MRLRNLGLLLLGAIALTGCAKVGVKTVLNGDSSFTRTVKYAVTKNDQAQGMSGVPSKPDDVFRIPSSAPGVKVDTTTEKEQTVVTVTRSVAAGANAMQDVTLLSSKKTPVLTSSVSVKRLGDGNIEYVELLHWVGPKTKSDQDVPGEFRAIIKKALPARFQTTAVIDKLTHRVLTETVHILFGPADPLLSTALLNQDLFELKMHGAFFARLVPAFQEEATGMTDDEAKAVLRKMMPDLDSSTVMKNNAHPTPPDPTAPPTKDSGNDGLTPLTFTVGFKGRIVKTNGIVDPATGDVYWSLYSAVAEFGDVELRLVVEPSK
ncbi:MAG: hypothetical protein JSS72_10040 [Armatimonadetes bacterium]|nr:hypothetical protein [Armatimonadota bacterium]